MNLLKKKVSKVNLFTEYVKIINGVLQLSPREAEVLSFILEKDSIGVKPSRLEFLERTGVSQANYSRYIGVLRSKGLIVRGQTGKWVVNDLVRPIVKDNKFELKFVLELGNA
jgi:DNA-binding MarR family transcriptional regulator